MKETVRYVGPDGEALHPGDRIGLEPPGCLKRDDGLDAWLTALRHEMARDCELPEKVMFGDDLPDDLPPDGGGLGPWHWLGLDALKIKNPEVQILGKDSGMILNVKGIGEAVLLAALFNAAKPDRDDMMYSQHESMTKEVASELLDELSGHKAGELVFIRKLYGRRIYSYFWHGMKQMDGTQYDNENGQGKAAEVVAALRREIAAKKNAERKAERAKRHRVAVYWQEDNDRICTVASGKDEHRNVLATAYLLGTLLADVQEERRSAEYNGAIMKVDEIIRECGRNGEADD